MSHKPWNNLLLHSSFSFWNQNSLATQLTHCLFTKSAHKPFSKHSCINLLMSRFLLLFPCLILKLSPLSFFFASLLSSLVSLSNNKFGIHNLLVFLLLTLNNGLFSLLKHLHSSLLQCLLAQDVKHWLDLLIEVEELFVSLIDLSRLAALLLGHFRLEKWYWRPIKIEFSCNSLLSLLWLIC